MSHRALEFYAGIGGMHYGLVAALPDAQLVKAFEVNDLANDVYQHNFKIRARQVSADSVHAP